MNQNDFTQGAQLSGTELEATKIAATPPIPQYQPSTDDTPTDPPPADPAKPPVDPLVPPVDPAAKPVDPLVPPVDPNAPIVPVDPLAPPVDPNAPPVDPAIPAPVVQTPEQVTAAAREALLKELGFDNLETLQNKLKDPETPEQIEARQKEYNRKLQVYAIEKNLLSPHDLAEVERVREAPAQELVYKEFSTGYLAEHKDRKDEDGAAWPVTPDEVQDAFNDFYHIGSKNSALEARGLAVIEDRAGKIRAEQVGKFDAAKSTYDAEQATLANIPAFQSFVKGTIDSAIPNEFVLKAGEGDEQVVYQLDAVDRAEIEKGLVNNELFGRFLQSGATPELIAEVQESILKDIHWKNREKINETLYSKGHAAGLKGGSNTGARAPFQMTKPLVAPAAAGLTEKDRADLRSQNPYS